MKALSVVLLTIVLALDAVGQAKPIRLMAEAEDFKISQGWGIVPYRENYFASTFAVTFLSRMACLGAPAQLKEEAVAEQVVNIPRDGSYRVMVRYEQPYNFSCEFTMEVKQGSRMVSKHVYGRLKDPKIWAMVGGQRMPMARYFWGGTDNIVWQEFQEVQLKKGKASIRLLAGPQLDGGKPRVNAAKRHVDVVCLTDDKAGWELQKKTAYLSGDGWLTQAGDIYMRFTNRGDAPASVVMAGAEIRSPHKYGTAKRDWASTTVLKAGYVHGSYNFLNAGPRVDAVNAGNLAAELDPATHKKVTEEMKLQPGQRSGWVPVGQMIDGLFDSNWHVTVPEKQKIEAEIALPDGRGGLKAVRKLKISGRETFSMSGCVNPNPEVRKELERTGFPPRIWTINEALTNLRDRIRKFPKKGKRPKRLLVYNIMGWGGRGIPVADEISRLLGDNTYLNPKPITKSGILCHWPSRSIPNIKKAEAAGKFKDLLVLSYGDETHIYPHKPTDAQFAAWLKKRGVNWKGPVTYATNRKDPLFYYSQICGKEIAVTSFASATREFTRMGAYTGANYSPHGNYLVSDIDYVRPFKMRAMTLPWSEDYVWQVPEFSIQVMGYMVSAFRAGAKYNNDPIHMYVMPHSPGNTPRDFRLSFYTVLAHGAKQINYFCASPDVVTHSENHIAVDDTPMWKAVHDVTHEAGVIEDYIMDGKVRPAQVGLLLSSVDELIGGMNNQNLAAHNNERKAIYYALRHSQVPVDFLTEDDLIGGLAKNYKVIYVTQRWMHSKALKALQKWTQAGGTTVALAGGGFLNEFNRANPEANEFYGVKQQALAEDPNLDKWVPRKDQKHPRGERFTLLTKQDLPLYTPFDQATWGEGDAKVSAGLMVWKQTLTPSDGKVLGTYKNGKPAIIEKAHGKGRSVLFGFLPGQAYLKSGLKIIPADRGAVDASSTHYLPTAMDKGLRAALVDAFLPADFARQVICSETLVETSCIDTVRPKKRLAVPLMNYSGKKIAKLTIKIRGIKRANSVRSVEQGKLKPVFADGYLTIELPLNITDMLLIDL
tara:strand:+ start:151 stop:3294 length:3144 start_codon:yes stop_codon:yes gene_type:complete